MVKLLSSSWTWSEPGQTPGYYAWVTCKLALDIPSYATLCYDFGFIDSRLTLAWSQVDMLTRLSSPYLLSLWGYCMDDNHRLLVYEYMRNGSLQDQLRRNGRRTSCGLSPFVSAKGATE